MIRQLVTNLNSNFYKMTKIGDKLPDLNAFVMGASGPEKISLATLTSNKNVVLLGIPAAFSGVCSEKHLPDYLAKYDLFREKGVDTIVCLSVNDVFVMNAYGKFLKTEGRFVMLADTDAKIVKKLGLAFDLSKLDMGPRSNRFVIYAKNGVITYFEVEDDFHDYKKTSADQLLNDLSESASNIPN